MYATRSLEAGQFLLDAFLSAKGYADLYLDISAGAIVQCKRCTGPFRRAAGISCRTVMFTD
jgi:hypothetical protein